MNSPEHLPSETHKPITGYLWGALAVLTCPCHLPILARHCCKVSDEAAFCLIQRPYISKTLLT
ncbi:hypothetical protein RZP76_28275, partial [Raoultella ornithinolytica]|nr:hypothetical protein [Raoultella ornithinolytica]